MTLPLRSREAADPLRSAVILRGVHVQACPERSEGKDLLQDAPFPNVKRPSEGEEILRGLKPAQDDMRDGKARRPEAGSTLIELIVVLVLIALLFGVTIPALTAVPRTASAEGSLDSLRYAAVRSGAVIIGDSVVAFPDGRTLARGRRYAH